jgi:tetratricopeptide (TPR) repeat protein
VVELPAAQAEAALQSRAAASSDASATTADPVAEGELRAHTSRAGGDAAAGAVAGSGSGTQPNAAREPAAPVSANPDALAAYERGQAAEARRDYHAALEAYRQAVELDPENPRLLAAAGRAAHALSRLDEAEGFLARALEAGERELGPYDASVTEALSLIGGVYRDQKRYEEAEAAYERALDNQIRALGAAHPEVAAILYDLALLQKHQGNFDEALTLFESGLAIEEGLFGASHPNLAARLKSMALVYRDAGRYEEAAPLLQRSLEIREEVYGPADPRTVGAITSLAEYYADQYYERALRIGTVNPQVSATVNRLALDLRADGHVDQAEDIYEWALEISQQALGSEDRNTIFLSSRYAQFLRSIGRSEEADELSGS